MLRIVRITTFAVLTVYLIAAGVFSTYLYIRYDMEQGTD